MKIRGVKVTSVLITLGILIILIIASPAHAFALVLNISDPFIVSGNTINFAVSSIIPENEQIKIEKFKVNIIGPENISCEFTPNGEIIGECPGISINVVAIPDEISNYGYGGYGYGYNVFTNGTLSYMVSFNTNSHKIGIYSTEFILVSEGKEFKKIGNNLFIFDKDGLRGCSIRAKDGAIYLNNESFENKNNKLSFHIPLGNAVAGEGSLQVQSKGQRVTYDFTVLGVLENNPSNALVITKGVYKFGRTNTTKNEISMLSIDKKYERLSLASKSLNVADMKINLMNSPCLK